MMTDVTDLVAGIGPAALDRADLLLDVGAHHPSTHGSLRLALTFDGSGDERVVVTAEPLVGHLHRGAEKLFEVRDYRQITMLANRHDWLSAFANEIGVVTAVERMLGIEVPERATWLRTLLVELNRMLAHLLFLGAVGPATDPAVAATRERLQSLLEAASGGRVHYGFSRVGGVREELPAGWVADARAVLAAVATPAVPDGLAGLGVLDPALIDPYGVSGPMARASGAPLDLRRDRPYLAYDRLEVPLVVQQAGDCAARYAQLVAEVELSRTLALQCLAMLETVTGPVNVRLPKVVKAPEGAIYVRTENPLGVMGYYLVSHGERTPWRLHLRTASFANVQVLRALLPGTRLADLATVLASVFFVVGDIDK